MTIPDHDAWVLRRLLVGHTLNGELQVVSKPFRGVAEKLATLSPNGRLRAWNNFLGGLDDTDDIITALAAVDPAGPPPEASSGPTRCYATLEDISNLVSAQAWVWRGWLADGVLNVVASEPGTGKTRFAMDLARRLYSGLPWPDGQANERAVGTRTLWVQGDRNFAEMLQVARDFGIPEDAVALGAAPDDPTGGLDLDDPATLSALAERIEDAAPALVVIDTVGMTTGRNLCRPEEAREFFAPLMDLAGKAGVAFLGLTHLSKDKEALGRRIVEKARVILKMTQPDPQGQPNRRRLWVDKSAVVKPPALGITMGDAGNEYDFTPPDEPEQTPRKRGPATEKLEACKQWLAEVLTPHPGRVTDIRRDAEKAGYAAGTLYAARDALGVEECTLERRKWWSMPSEVED